MAAAALVPTVIHKEAVHATATSGTPLRIMRYYLKITKVIQNDWVVVPTYLDGTFISVSSGYTIDGNGDGVPETNTYTATGTKITLTSATTGTTYLVVLMSQ